MGSSQTKNKKIEKSEHKEKEKKKEKESSNFEFCVFHYFIKDSQRKI